MFFDFVFCFVSWCVEDFYCQWLLLELVQGLDVVVDGQLLLVFCFNDYFGLVNYFEVIVVLCVGVECWGVGGGVLYLVVGYSGLYYELELVFVEFIGWLCVLLFFIGYMVNFGVVIVLVGKGDMVLEDCFNYVLLLDVGLFFGVCFLCYLYNDLVSFVVCLDKVEGNILVVIDGVFSMDGNFVDLLVLVVVVQVCGVWLMVDDVYGFGLLGVSGGGIVEYFGFGQEQVLVLIGIFGKGFGIVGVFVVGSEELIEILIQYVWFYIYIISQLLVVVCVILKSLELLCCESWWW